MDAPLIPPPHDQAPHSEWMAYAVSQGMPEEQAAGLTRDQIRVRFMPADAPLSGAPDLDWHDQDPEAIAARREARRKPWERP